MSLAKRVVIVDDEENIGRSLKLILDREGYHVTAFSSIQTFTEAAPAAEIFLFDLRLPDGTGLDLLRQVQQSEDKAAVIMISGQATIGEAVEATRLGAFDFLEKPLARDRVLLALKNAWQQTALRLENAQLRTVAGSPERLLGAHPAFLRTVEQATLAARTDARILLSGESGTGKELLAAHIHDSSPFRSGPLVKLNCAAIPTELLESELFGHERGAFTGALGMRRGKFELAHGGTLFLDEVADLHATAQAKLLRVLQEGELHRLGGERPVQVAVRVVAATNRSLQEEVLQHRFRDDLYYRLCVVPIVLPALRERVSDIPLLASHFLEQFCQRNSLRKKTLQPDTVAALRAYSWPGNARELRNVVERMAILTPGDVIPVASVPHEIVQQHRPAVANGLHEARDTAERDRILRALQDSNWNISSAARGLGVERTNLHKRMRALGLRRQTGSPVAQ